MDYKNAGVDIEAGYQSVELMKKHIKRTMGQRSWEGSEDFPAPFLWIPLREWKNQLLFPVQTDAEQK